MVKVIKVALIILLLGCLLKMPYGYFQFVRFAALVGFGFLAYQSNENKKQTETAIYIILALLFQPFIKVALGREIWNIVDVVVAIGLGLSFFRK